MEKLNIYTVEEANEGIDIKIYDINNVDTGIIIHALCKDSDEFRKANHALQKKRQNKLTRGGFRNINTLPTPEETENDNIALIARMTKSWSYNEKNTIPFLDGRELECNIENAILFYKNSPHSMEQVDYAIGDRANLSKA